MPRKLRCSLTILAAIALVAAFASSAAQAQFKNADHGHTKGTDIRPWTTTHGSTALLVAMTVTCSSPRRPSRAARQRRDRSPLRLGLLPPFS